jgi:NADH-quinone oxidoreductase subunit I
MRATAPSGSAAYTGRVAWSGELGYGVRAPEPAQLQADGEHLAADDINIDLADDGFGSETHDHDHGSHGH